MSQATAGWRSSLEVLRWGQLVMVMGWSGFYLCMDKLEQLWGFAPWASVAIACVDVVLFLALCSALVLRVLFMPQSVIKELGEPMSLSASAAFAVAMILLSRVVWSLSLRVQSLLGSWSIDGPERALQATFQNTLQEVSDWLWLTGAGLELILSLAVMLMCLNLWRQNKGVLSHVTPVMFIPAVGNVLVVLAGVPLGHVAWSVMQFTLGLVLWPLVSYLLLLRVKRLGALANQARPSWFISLSPPSVVGLSLGVFQAPAVWIWACWALGLLVLLSVLPLLNEARRASFSNGFWAFSFPLAAWCSLSITLSEKAQSVGSAEWGGVPGEAFFALGFGLVHVALSLLTLGIGALVVWLSAQNIGRSWRALKALGAKGA